MKVIGDQGECASAGNCVLNAPGVFDQRDEDGVVVVLAEYPPVDQEDEVRRAVAACPAQAISIEE
jgi:ferredoxin